MFIIRPICEADASAVTDIYRPLVEGTTVSFELVPPTKAEMLGRIKRTTTCYPWLVAISSDVVVGYAYASRHRERAGYSSSVDVSIYLRRDVRGQGIGTALYSSLLGELGRRGFHRAFAGIALPNDASIALHRKFGFDLIGVYREVGRKFDAWIDVAWWQRALD